MSSIFLGLRQNVTNRRFTGKPLNDVNDKIVIQSESEVSPNFETTAFGHASIYIAFLCCVLFISCSSDAPVEQGPIHTSTYYNSYNMKTSLDVFHENGKLKEEYTYFNSGNVDSYVEYKYDANWNLIEKIDTSEGSITYFTYDDQNRLLQSFEKSLMGEFKYETTWIDEQSMKIDTNFFGKRIAHTYLDENRNDVAWHQFNFDGDTIAYTMTKYDDQDREIEDKYYDEGRFFRHRTRAYNDHGDILKEQYFKEDGSLEKEFVYKYDDANRLISTKQIKGGNADFEIRYTYKKNERISITTFTSLAPQKRRKYILIIELDNSID